MTHRQKAQMKKERSVAAVDPQSFEQRVSPVSAPIGVSNKEAKRVIAPFVRIVRKGHKPQAVEESKQFKFYLQNKPTVLLRDLSMYFSDSIDMFSLIHDSAEALKIATKSASVTLYMIDPSAEEIYQWRRTPVRDRHKVRWRIEEGSTVAAHVAYNKEWVIVDDILHDKRFPEGIGYENETVTSVLCFPVVTVEGHCFIVLELYKSLFDEIYSDDDIKLGLVVIGWMSAAIHENSKRLALQRQQELNHYLLDLTRCFFGDTVDLQNMLSEILEFANVSLGAERGAFYILDKESDDMVADVFQADLSKPEGPVRTNARIKFNKDRGIAGLVARTGHTINVKNLKETGLEIISLDDDHKAGHITRSLLCMPIMSVDGVIGVMKLVNKKNGGFFTGTDEDLLQVFSTYCSLAIYYSKMSKKKQSAMHLNNIFQKLLQHQAKPCRHDLEYYLKNRSISVPQEILTHQWCLRPQDPACVPQILLYMLKQITNPNEIHSRSFMTFILCCRNAYKANPYHNFFHAFNVCHFIFLIVKHNPKVFSPFEVKSMFVAGLCIAADHTGLTNSFLTLTKNDLIYVHGTLPQHQHSSNIAKYYLNELRPFKNFSDEDYKVIAEEIEAAIVSTENSILFSNLTKLSQLWNTDSFDWKNPEHRIYLRRIILKAADLWDLCSLFSVSKQMTDNLFEEYYSEGDKLKELGLNVIDRFDRELANRIPELQIKFLSSVALPVYDLMGRILPNTAQLHKEAEVLRDSWHDIIKGRNQKCWRQEDSVAHKRLVY